MLSEVIDLYNTAGAEVPARAESPDAPDDSTAPCGLAQ